MLLPIVLENLDNVDIEIYSSVIVVKKGVERLSFSGGYEPSCPVIPKIITFLLFMI